MTLTFTDLGRIHLFGSVAVPVIVDVGHTASGNTIVDWT